MAEEKRYWVTKQIVEEYDVFATSEEEAIDIVIGAIFGKCSFMDSIVEKVTAKAEEDPRA